MPRDVVEEIAAHLTPRDLGRLRAASRHFSSPEAGGILEVQVREIFASRHPEQESMDPYLLYRFCIREADPGFLAEDHLEVAALSGLPIPFGSSVGCLQHVDRMLARAHARNSESEPFSPYPVRLQMLYELLQHAQGLHPHPPPELWDYLLRDLHRWQGRHVRALLDFAALLGTDLRDIERVWAAACPAQGPWYAVPLARYSQPCQLSVLWVRTQREDLTDQLHAATGILHDPMEMKVLAMEHRPVLDTFKARNLEACLATHIHNTTGLLDALAAGASIHAVCVSGIQPGQVVSVFPLFFSEYLNRPQGRLDLVRTLLEYGPSLNQVHPSMYESPLLWCLRLGMYQRRFPEQVTLVRLLLMHGVRADRPTGSAEDMPLILAIQHAPEAVVELLLRYNAAVNRPRHPSGDTALMLAAQRSHCLVLMLLRAGANVGAENVHGQTAFFRAVNPVIAHTLLRHGADIRHVDGIWDSVLHHDLRQSKVPKVLAMVPVMAGRAPEFLDWQNMRGQTALMLVQQERVLRAFLAAGASVHPRDVVGDSVLHYLCLLPAPVPALRLVLERGANVSVANRHGRTPLMTCRTPEAAKLLLQHGARPDAVDAQGQSAIGIHVSAGRVPLVHVLLRHLQDAEPEVGAASALLNRPSKQGYTALMLAPTYRLARMLLENGADPNVRGGFNGKTALMYAVMRRSERLVRLLLKHRANPTILDDGGMSALTLAQTMHPPRGTGSMLLILGALKQAAARVTTGSVGSGSVE